jgi:cathepsin F
MSHGFMEDDEVETPVNEELDSFSSFKNYMSKYNKQYSSVKEMNIRFKIYKDNLSKLKTELNKNYEVGVTYFFDLTDREFEEKYANHKLTVSDIIEAEHLSLKTQTKEIPSEWDWRHLNTVSEVRNQLGSSWASAMAGNLEGLYAKNYKSLISLTEENMILCNGHNHGNIAHAFHGLFHAGDNVTDEGECHRSKPVSKVKGFGFISKVESDIMQELYSRGPLAAGINANKLKYYNSGIINVDEKQCDPLNLTHVVLIVGYGESYTGVPYWIVKNSWGTDWGEDGYFRIARGKGICGINRYVVTGIMG